MLDKELAEKLKAEIKVHEKEIEIRQRELREIKNKLQKYEN